jgi:hypothetical protein
MPAAAKIGRTEEDRRVDGPAILLREPAAVAARRAPDAATTDEPGTA